MDKEGKRFTMYFLGWMLILIGAGFTVENILLSLSIMLLGLAMVVISTIKWFPIKNAERRRGS